MKTRFLLIRDHDGEVRGYIEDGAYLVELQAMLPQRWSVTVETLRTLDELREWLKRNPQLPSFGKVML